MAGAQPAAEAAPGRALAGLSLTEALLELQARGLDIVFTSRLVRPELRVDAEPAAAGPRQLLDQILAPHGLRAEEGVGGALVVVPAAPGVPSGTVAGTVCSGEFHEPLGGALVRLVESGAEATSTANGRFEIGGLEPGVYTLEVEAPGFLPSQMSRVEVAPGRSGDLDLDLRPVPFIYDEIAVRPSRLSLLRDEPAAPFALSRGDIEALPQLGGDVFRALPLFPGIAANDFTAQFHIHGGRRDEVQILLDGQELYDAHHLKDFDNALSVVAFEELSGLDLSTGAFPADHGDRMSGVLDMTTVTPSGPPHTRLSVSLLTATASSTGGFDGGRGGWLVSARRGSIDLANRVLGREDPSFWDLFGKLEWRPGERHHLRVSFLRASDRLDFQEVIPGDELIEEKRFDTEYDSSYLWLTHQALLGERLLVETAVSSTALERDRRGDETEEEQTFAVLDRRDFDVLGLAQRWSWQAGADHSLKWGFELRRYDADYDYANEVERDLVLSAPGTEPAGSETDFEGELRGEHTSAWVADRVSPLTPLTLELGLRYDRHTLTGDTLLSPRFNAAWRFGESAVARLGWGFFHQSQRPYELEVQDGETRLSPAERSEHWVLGYERLLGRDEGSPLRALRLEAYRREIADPRARYENLFEAFNTFPEIEPDRVRIEPERAHAHGIELLLRGSAGARTGWWVGYAWAEAEDRLDGENVLRQIDQTHTVNLNLDRRLGRRWRLTAAWRFHTGWPTTPVTVEEVEDEEGESEPVSVVGALNSERLSSYHRLDLRLSRDWNLRSGRLVFFADVQNLYNRKNLAGFDIALDDEEGVVVAEETWPGFFASAGVSWEF